MLTAAYPRAEQGGRCAVLFTFACRVSRFQTNHGLFYSTDTLRRISIAPTILLRQIMFLARRYPYARLKVIYIVRLLYILSLSFTIIEALRLFTSSVYYLTSKFNLYN